MSRKTAFFGLVGLLGLFSVLIFIGGAGWGQKPPASVGILPVRDSTLAQGKASSAVSNAKSHALINDFGKMPVFFVPNRGQTDDKINFYVQGDDKTIFFAPDGVTFALEYPAPGGDPKGTKRWTVKMDFLGASENVEPEGLDKTGAVISYFRGKPEEWNTGLPAYSKIIYHDLWPGIDLVYKGEFDKLKYEFIVQPGADPSKIKLAYRGVERVALTEEGRLEVKTPAGAFEDDIPLAFQELEGGRRSVSVAYSPESPAAAEPEAQARVCSFEVGEYDRKRPLVIDPAVLVYCGYIGGVNSESSGGLAVDASGNIYITGTTDSDETSFPVTVGPDLTKNANRDYYIAKVNPSGTGLVYCGYIGAAGGYGACDIAIDNLGNAYITGVTSATEITFPVIGGPDLTHNGGLDCFVAKVNPSGTGLVYCGYIGGSNDDIAKEIKVDDSGNASVLGNTSSSQSTFPVAVGPDLTHNGSGDVFIAKINSSGSGLEYCGYIGGSQGDSAGGLALDGAGTAYVTGWTDSSQATFPVAVGPDLTINGGSDDFVAKVNSSGAGLDYCGYIGGADLEAWPSIAVDGSGNAYIGGATYSSEATFPVVVGPDLTFNGDMDVFVAKVSSSGTSLVYCGYVGGAGWDNNTGGIAVDNLGNAYITGRTNSTESTFPVVNGPDLTYNGGEDVFVAKINPTGTALVYCGYIGGVAWDIQGDIAVDGSGIAYVNGITESNQSSFPVVGGPDLTFNGDMDVFVAKISDVPGPPITSLLPDSADAGDPGFLLSVIGSELVDGAVVRWDGSARPTTFVSEFEVEATIDASDLVAGKTVYVTVRNPNGGVSNSLPFTINNPLPSLTSISPTQVTGGGAAFTLTVQGLNFVPNSVVRWNGSNRTTTYVSATELQGAILSSDIAAGGEAQVTVSNPAPSGGVTSAIALPVSTYTLSSTPTSATVTAGQSATYTIQLTPQYGSFDALVTFNCVGLPSKCTPSFSPATITPGAATVTTTLTLTTAASLGSTSASLFGTIGFGPPTLGLFAFVMTLLLGNAIRRRIPWRTSRRWLAACALVCLIMVIGSCSSGGGDDNPPYTGTPKGTHQISVQGTSGNMTVATVVTLVVN